MAKAEGVAAPYVEARKQFETRKKQMKVWEGTRLPPLQPHAQTCKPPLHATYALRLNCLLLTAHYGQASRRTRSWSHP